MQAAPSPPVVPNLLSRQVLTQVELPSNRSAPEPPFPLPVATLSVRRTPVVPEPTSIPRVRLPVTVLLLIWVPALFPSTAMPRRLLLARLSTTRQFVQLRT